MGFKYALWYDDHIQVVYKGLSFYIHKEKFIWQMEKLRADMDAAEWRRKNRPLQRKPINEQDMERHRASQSSTHSQEAGSEDQAAPDVE